MSTLREALTQFLTDTDREVAGARETADQFSKGYAESCRRVAVELRELLAAHPVEQAPADGEFAHGCLNHQVMATDGDGEPLFYHHCGICGSRAVQS